MIPKIMAFLKRYWLLVLLAMIAGGLIILKVLQRNQPSLPGTTTPTATPQTTLESPLIEGVSLPAQTKLNLSQFDFPTQLTVYQGQEKKLTLETATQIAKNLGFKGEPQKSEDVVLGNFYTWTQADRYLSIAADANEIDYGLDLYQAALETEGPIPSPEEAKKSLESLINRLELKASLETKWQKEQYLTQGYSFQPTSDLSKADFIKIGYNLGLDNYQLINQNPREPLISAILGKNEQLVQFHYRLNFTQFEKKSAYVLKTKPEVEQTLVPDGKIVYLGTSNESTLEPTLIEANFSQINLSYLQPTDKNPSVQPVFVLSGQATLSEGETTEIIALLPAITDQWLKPAPVTNSPKTALPSGSLNFLGE